MQMQSLRTKDYIISVFIDLDGLLTPTDDEKEKLKNFIYLLKDNFDKEYCFPHGGLILSAVNTSSLFC